MQRNTLKSFQWSFITALLRKIVLFGVFLLIAKAITKEDLGLFREFSLILAIVSGISFLGFKDLLMVKKEDTKQLFYQLFSFSLISAIISLLLLLFLAPLIGKYYKSQVLANLLVTFSPLIFLEIFRLTIRSYYQKKLKFKLLSLIETVNVLFYSSLIVVFYFYKLDIARLIIIFYSGNLLEFFLLICFDKKLIGRACKKVITPKTLKAFGNSYKKNYKFLLTATSNNIISLLINDLPVIILGVLFNPTFIGIYYLGNQIIGQPVSLACNSLGQVLFPTFTLMDKKEIYEKIHKFFHLVTLLVLPLFFLFVIYVMNFLPLILGDRWNDALPIVAILAFPLATTLLMNPISSLPYVLEKPHVEMVFMFANLVFKSLAIYLGHFGGFYTALIFYATATFMINLSFLSLFIHLLNGNIFKTLISIFLKSLPTLALILLYKLLSEQNIYATVGSLTVLIGIYLLIAYKNKLFKLY